MTKKDPRFTGYSITTGTVRYFDLCYLITTNDDVVKEGYSGSLLFSLDAGNWGAGAKKWTGCSGTVCYVPNERYLALGVDGSIEALGGGVIKDEPSIAVSSGVDPQKRGALREIRTIAKGKAFAVGAGRQAYVRDAEGQWRCIDQSAQNDDALEASFESIDGFSEQDIYVVGWDGELWNYNGDKFHQLKSPTTANLSKVLCAEDGFAYACGQKGTLFKGRGDKWELISHESTVDDFWGMCWFQGHLYLSSLNFVYRLENGKLKVIDFGDDIPKTCYHLSAADGIMWSIGAKDVMEYNGSAWKRILEI